MARHCKQCGRPLTTDHHDVDGKRPIPDRKHGFRMVRAWACRVRRLADHTALDLETGERKVSATYVPNDDMKQRTKENNLRFVPTAILEARSRG